MPLDNLRKAIEELSKFDVAEESIKIINANSSIIREMVKAQLMKGVDAGGSPVTLKRKGRSFPFYAASTFRKKELEGIGFGKETGFVTNYMSGQFYSRMVVKTSGTVFTTSSDVPYFADMILKRGTGYRMLELSPENLKKFSSEILAPELQKVFKSRTNGI